MGVIYRFFTVELSAKLAISYFINNIQDEAKRQMENAVSTFASCMEWPTEVEQSAIISFMVMSIESYIENHLSSRSLSEAREIVEKFTRMAEAHQSVLDRNTQRVIKTVLNNMQAYISMRDDCSVQKVDYGKGAQSLDRVHSTLNRSSDFLRMFPTSPEKRTPSDDSSLFLLYP